MKKPLLISSIILLLLAAIVVLVFLLRQPSQSATSTPLVDDMREWWSAEYFTSASHHQFANAILYTTTYDEYFAMLQEFYPIRLSRRATDYDRHQASLMQFDSLMAFPGNTGSTIEIYLYESYFHSYIAYSSDRVHDQLLKANLYFSEEDSAWNHYFQAMITVIDSIVLYRPSCLGTISYLESDRFQRHLKEEYLNAQLQLLFYDQMPSTTHMTITPEMISQAFDSLSAHLEVPGHQDDDIVECYVPVDTRIRILQLDHEAWLNYIATRNQIELSLPSHLQSTYRNITNNLMRTKLWLLKNEYKYFSLSGEYHKELLLPYHCTDEQLLNFQFSLPN
jgi:hypothetical protein